MFRDAFADGLDSLGDRNRFEFHELMLSLLNRSMSAGYGEQQLTALIKLLRTE